MRWYKVSIKKKPKITDVSEKKLYSIIDVDVDDLLGFPITVFEKNRDVAREFAEVCIRDCGENPDDYIYTIDETVI